MTPDGRAGARPPGPIHADWNTMALLSQRAALTGALAILRDLADSQPCDLSGYGACGAHGWNLGHEACPQFRLKTLLRELDKQAPTPPYTQLSLLAMLHGLGEYQEVHVRVAVNGTAHLGVLGATQPTGGQPPFHVDVLHGERIEQVSADDILEAEVCGRSLMGVPLNPTHDPA